MPYIDETSQLDRAWLLAAARGAAAPCEVPNTPGVFRLAPARLRWPYLVEPRVYEPDPKEGRTERQMKYEAALIFPWELSVAEIFGPAEAFARQVGAKHANHPKCKWPWKDQAEVLDKRGERQKGFNPTGFCATPSGSEYKIGLFDTGGNPIEADEAKVKFRGGNWVIPSVAFFAYERNGNRGVSMGLRSLVFLAEDLPLISAAVSGEAVAAGLSGLAPPPVANISNPDFD